MLNLMLGNTMKFFSAFFSDHFQYNINRLVNLQNPKLEVTQKRCPEGEISKVE